VDLDAETLERLVPDELAAGGVTGGEALRISLERYEFAAQHLRAGRLLDLACGVGYGTRILADRAGERVEAVGVDRSPEAVAYARRRYGAPRVRFVASDAMDFTDPEGFDTIVSIETIEHLPDPRAFVARLVRMLRPGGVLVASVPTTPSVDANPHHLHDFSERSFRRLFVAHGLAERGALVQDQPFAPVAVLARSEPRLRQRRRGLPSWYARHPGSLLRRIAATLRHGFKNRYLTVAWQAPR
jgi:SAM-dependent methyltransferase